MKGICGGLQENSRGREGVIAMLNEGWCVCRKRIRFKVSAATEDEEERERFGKI